MIFYNYLEIVRIEDFDLKLSKDGVNHIHNSMEKIFLIEDLTLEKYKVLEKAFNLDSLDNSLFDMTKVPNKSLDYYKKIEIGNYFYLTYLDDYQLDSIDDEEYKLDDNTYKILNFVINNTNKNFEISHREMIKAMSLGEEYISLVNNKELFNYIFEKYEKTILAPDLCRHSRHRDPAHRRSSLRGGCLWIR